MTIEQKEADRRAAELEAQIGDAGRAFVTDPGLAHRLTRQAMMQAILWGMAHQRELTETDLAMGDDSLDEVPEG